MRGESNRERGRRGWGTTRTARSFDRTWPDGNDATVALIGCETPFRKGPRDAIDPFNANRVLHGSQIEEIEREFHVAVTCRFEFRAS